MRPISVRVHVLVLGVLVGAGSLVRGVGTDVSELRQQLAAAAEAEDNPAIIELSRRIVEMAPQDAQGWETLARTQLKVDEVDRCAATLDAWEKAVRPRPAVVDDLCGDVAKARKDYGTAERFWRAYVTIQPKAVETLEKLADLYAQEERWPEGVEFCTRALDVRESAADLTRRAQLLVGLREWDKAFADIDKANALDPSNTGVKELLPQFELLRTFLPQIKSWTA